jgi:hypothetical protein
MLPFPICADIFRDLCYNRDLKLEIFTASPSEMSEEQMKYIAWKANEEHFITQIHKVVFDSGDTYQLCMKYKHHNRTAL